MSEYNIDSFKEQLDFLYGKKNFADIESFLKDSVDQVQQLRLQDPLNSHLSDAELVVTNELLSFYRGIDRYRECLDLSERIKNVLIEKNRVHSLDYASFLLNTATTYVKMGDGDEALNLFSECEGLLKELNERDHYIMASLYHNRVPVYLSRREYKKALEDLMSALRILEKLGNKEQAIAITYGTMAACYHKLGHIGSGLAAVDKALRLYAICGEGAHIGAAFYTKGCLLYDQRAYEEAKEHYIRAADLTKKYFGENSEYRLCNENIAKIDRIVSEHGK